jgi:tryptophan-rich sensory protein
MGIGGKRARRKNLGTRAIRIRRLFLLCYGEIEESDMRQEIIVATVVTMTVLGVGGAMSTVGPWYRDLRKPPWNPPNWAFAPGWTIIGVFTAWAGILAWTNAPDAAAHLNLALLFGLNGVLNILWSPLFFKFRRPDWALVEVPFLWLSVFAMIVGVAPYSALAAWLLLPYLVWVAFAGFLNYTIVRLNPPFTTHRSSASLGAR